MAGDQYYIAGILSAFALVQAWIGISSPNEVSWSVSAEWFAYICYPFALVATKRLHLLAKISIILILLVGLELYGGQNALLRIVPEFALGMVARDLCDKLPSINYFGRLGGAFAIVILIVLETSLDTAVSSLYVSTFAFLIICIVNKEDFIHIVLSNKIAVYLGEISYSLYLLHSLVRSFIRSGAVYAGLDPTSPLLVTLSVVCSIFLASTAYHLLELPGRQLLRGARARTPQETTIDL